ncbi:unnamed protein product [Soboliphyme baturini]|uniref:Transposase n=1 Tax=Soboliphyme baturini TaxID=241478 RepID=A0A183III3_9BILA|nr:unnamed protein product [Soboliphyme baturini]
MTKEATRAFRSHLPRHSYARALANRIVRPIDRRNHVIERNALIAGIWAMDKCDQAGTNSGRMVQTL